MFSKIKGQNRALKVLKDEIINHRIGNSYLFYGPPGVGKFTTALFFAMAVNCYTLDERKPCGICKSCMKFTSLLHPDLLYVFPIPNFNIGTDGSIREEKMLQEYNQYLDHRRTKPWEEFFFSGNVEIRIESIRLLQEKISTSPYEARYKVCIIEDFDRINLSAANAFLKTLEEPPLDSIIIITTIKPDFILPTIKSRCQKIQFQKLHHKIIAEVLHEKGADQATANLYSRIANGDMERALRLFENESLTSRESSEKFLHLILENDDIGFLDFISQYRTSKTKSEFMEILDYLIIWFADLNNYIYNRELLINIDKTEILELMINRNHRVLDQIPAIMIQIEDMIKKLNHNVSPQLIGINIYNYLKSYFRL